jgi:hypothetical protein
MSDLFDREFYRMADELAAAVERLKTAYGPQIVCESPAQLLGRAIVDGIVAGLRPRRFWSWRPSRR